jgi:hypothetical protein
VPPSAPAERELFPHACVEFSTVDSRVDKADLTCPPGSSQVRLYAPPRVRTAVGTGHRVLWRVVQGPIRQLRSFPQLLIQVEKQGNIVEHPTLSEDQTIHHSMDPAVHRDFGGFCDGSGTSGAQERQPSQLRRQVPSYLEWLAKPIF